MPPAQQYDNVMPSPAIAKATVKALDITITATRHGIRVQANPNRVGTFLRETDGEVFLSETFLDLAAALHAQGNGSKALSALVQLALDIGI